eukprot:1975430-Rhodomonas_salina.5
MLTLQTVSPHNPTRLKPHTKQGQDGGRTDSLGVRVARHADDAHDRPENLLLHDPHALSRRTREHTVTAYALRCHDTREGVRRCQVTSRMLLRSRHAAQHGKVTRGGCGPRIETQSRHASRQQQVTSRIQRQVTSRLIQTRGHVTLVATGALQSRRRGRSAGRTALPQASSPSSVQTRRF